MTVTAGPFEGNMCSTCRLIHGPSTLVCERCGRALDTPIKFSVGATFTEVPPRTQAADTGEQAP